MAQKKYHIEYTDYDPELCSEIYLDTEGEAFQYLAEREIENIRDMEFDDEAQTYKNLVRIIRKGKGLKALLEAINEWLEECGIYVSYKLTREDPWPYTFDHESLLMQLDEAIAHRKKRHEDWIAKHGKGQ